MSTINNLADDLAKLGRYAEAVPMMRQALELKVGLYGAAHPTTLNSVDGLARFAFESGNYAEAEAMHRRALDGRTRALGLRHRQTLESQQRLADTLSTLGRFAEAERLAATAATVARETLGDRHLVTLAANDSHARALLGLRRSGEAEAVLRRQLAILDEKKQKGEDAGEGDELTAAVRVHLAMALAALGRRAEAEPLLAQGVLQLRTGVASTTSAVEFVADFYNEWNRREPDTARAARATEWKQRLAPRARRTQ